MKPKISIDIARTQFRNLEADAKRGYELERKGDAFLTLEERLWLDARRKAVR